MAATNYETLADNLEAQIERNPPVPGGF